VHISFDWSPHISSFIIRMPTSTHDIFTELVVQEIGSQLESVAHRNRMSQQSLIRSDRNQPRTSISMETSPLTTVTLSTHQTPPSHTPTPNIPPSFSRPHIRSNTKSWRGWLMNTYAVLRETSSQYSGLILSTELGLRKRRCPSGDLG